MRTPTKRNIELNVTPLRFAHMIWPEPDLSKKNGPNLARMDSACRVPTGLQGSKSRAATNDYFDNRLVGRLFLFGLKNISLVLFY